ncbi:hypothetical protein TNIN_80191 [Trichonephila inaurata madagascariensis]|uniref:Uncharacterized protein n=1 Tax=Trichonephila inaurata madagascariensis TaxID=2747483 RepID=A0A8X7BSE2_9ARAC|nr:hypothetical protein TNIN_80191 [Trichonephila inaurata madagascariensis]
MGVGTFLPHQRDWKNKRKALMGENVHRKLRTSYSNKYPLISLGRGRDGKNLRIQQSVIHNHWAEEQIAGDFFRERRPELVRGLLGFQVRGCCWQARSDQSSWVVNLRLTSLENLWVSQKRGPTRTEDV